MSIHFHLKKLNIMKTSFTHTFILFFFLCVHVFVLGLAHANFQFFTDWLAGSVGSSRWKNYQRPH